MRKRKLPGTKHIRTLDSREKAILWTIQGTHGVMKVTAGPMTHVGSAPTKRLQLGTTSPRPGAIGAALFLNGVKRTLSIYPVLQVSADVLQRALARTLSGYHITVEL